MEKEKQTDIFEKYKSTSNNNLLSDYQDAIRRFELDRIYDHDPSRSLISLEELRQVVLERMCLVESVEIRIN